ncbi:hypothetical protein [Rubrivirga marina]|uniref:Beta-ketoacyl synthase N-terminal domain-containing protein n=1 Tax=Rubrivirga marina TaxID=1196024 RepID=A0A271IY59_9BACT|nr:hypothetical protein [Rubrivirga marina]PAP75734.1 hypothetical protein BSZ37_04410 [Rubrivirga marina]
MRADDVRLSVRGVGLACSLGLGAVDACAAAFAGITRPTPMPGVDVFDPEEAEGVDLAVHAAPFVTEGFSGVARMARLAGAALDDLASRADLPDDGRTGICVALPSGYHLRRLEQAEAAEDPDPPPTPYALEADVRVEELRDRLVPTIRRFSKVALHPGPGATLFEDEAGFGALLRTADLALRGGAIRRCLVGGVDSPLDPATIRARDRAGVLFTPENSGGAAPGEAAAFVLVERADDRADGLTISGVAQGRDVPFVPDGEDRPAGVGLSRCLAATRAAEPGPIGAVYTSLNGAAHRAYDWGCALVRLAADGPFEPEAIHPATMVGAVGAATGPVAVALAEHARWRGWGPPAAAVWLASDAGPRASFRLTAS